MFKIVPILALAALPVLGALVAHAQEQHHLPATGPYAAVETRRTVAALKALNGTPAQQRSAIRQVEAAPGDYAPPALCALSAALVNAGHLQEAAFWFYTGQLRARCDAELSTDPTAGDAVEELTENYGPPINKYTFHHLPFLTALVPRVVAWDQNTPHDYDPRWIALSGMGAIQAGLGGSAPRSLILPHSRWAAVAVRNRQRFLTGFRDALRQVKANPPLGN